MIIPKVEPTLLDRAVAAISPEAGLRRLEARARLGLLAPGQFQGARSDRKALAKWKPRASSADEDALGDLPALRSRTRDLVRNNPLSAGAAKTFSTHVVGRGLRYRPQIDREFLGMSREEARAWERKARRAFAAWASGCDITRTQDFSLLQGLAFTGAFESGDVLAIRRHLKRKGDLISLKLQLVEADRISNPDDQPDGKGGIWGGVELDRDGAAVAYRIADRHPDSADWSKRTWKRIDAYGKSGERLAILLLQRERIGQTRGIPALAPVIEDLKQLDRFAESELMAAVVTSFFTVFLTTDVPEDEEAAAPLQGIEPEHPEAGTVAQRDRSVELGPGLVHQLDPGEGVTFADPKRPSQAFEPFVTAITQQIAVGLGIPQEILMKRFLSSYSASRAALEEAIQLFLVRRHWLATSFCHPILEWFLIEAIADGILEAPGFVDDPMIRRAYMGEPDEVWIGPAKPQLDELKETKAAILRRNAGLSTGEEETIRLTGGEWDRNHEQLAEERRRRIADDLEEPRQTTEPGAAA